MAKQIVNIGTAPNDQTGDPLRDAMNKINQNFTELYNYTGWGSYADGLITTPTLNITTTPSQLLIDGAGATTETSYLPLEIRGTGNLWDVATSKITPLSLGDSYNLRIDISIDAKASTPTLLTLLLDIGNPQNGTGTGGSILVVSRDIGLSKTPPYFVSVAFPIFSLSTFLTNGGSIWLQTDTGSLTIGSRSIFIDRSTKNLG